MFSAVTNATIRYCGLNAFSQFKKIYIYAEKHLNEGDGMSEAVMPSLKLKTSTDFVLRH